MSGCAWFCRSSRSMRVLSGWVLVCLLSGFAELSAADEPSPALPLLVPYEIPELEGADPHLMLEAAIGALRANDLEALIRITGGDQMFAQLEAEWSQHSTKPITDEDRAEFESLRQMFATGEAEDQFMAMLEPQLAGLKEQMDGLVTLVQVMAAERLAQTQALQDDGKRQVMEALDSIVNWLRETDVTSPQRARQAIGITGNLFRHLDFSSLEELAALDFRDVLGKGSMLLAGAKQVLDVYELSVDSVLDSFEADTISNDGETATVRTKVGFLGVPYVTDSEFVWVEGHWQPVEAISTVGEVMAEEAAAMASDPQETIAIPPGILQNLFDDLEIALAYRDEDSFRSYWLPSSYDQSLRGEGQSGAEFFAEASEERWILKPDTTGVMVLEAGPVVPCQAWSLDNDDAIGDMFALLVMHEGDWVVAGVEQNLEAIESLTVQYSIVLREVEPSQYAGSGGADSSPSAEASGIDGGQINLIDVEAAVVESLVVEPNSAGPVGLSQVLSVPDRDLLIVWMTWETTWKEEFDDITIEAEGVRLLDEQGAEHEPVGTMEARALFRSYFSNLWIYRPSQWEDSPTQRYYWNAVFAVPSDGKSFTLRAGNHERDFLVEVPAEPGYDPRWMANLKVLDAGFVDEVRSSFSAANQEFATTVRPMANKLLAVKVALTPTTGNSETREQFSWSTKWLGLITQSGLYVPAAGESDDYGGFGIDVGHSIDVDRASGEWRTDTTTVHFVVPGDTTSFDLTWLGSPAVSGSVSPVSPVIASDESMTTETSQGSIQTPDSADSTGSGSVISASEATIQQAGEAPAGVVETDTAVDPEKKAEEEQYKALVRSVQLRLSELGYDPGPADGIAGSGTRQAVRDYQVIAGLGVDGELSAGLLDHMQSDAAVNNPISVLPWAAQRAPVVGIATFANDSTAPWWTEGVGEALAELFGLDLSDAGGMEVADRSMIDAVAKNFDVSDGLSAGLSRQLGEAGVDYLVAGTLQEFFQKKGGVNIAGFGIGEKDARLSFQLMLINVVTGKVMRSVSIVDTSESGSSRQGIYKAGFDGALKDERRTAVGRAIRAAVARGGNYIECTILTPGPCS